MNGQRRNKSRDSEGRLTAEFSSGQLIVGICVSLFLALIFFVAGLFVGKNDPSLRTQQASNADEIGRTADKQSEAPRETPKGEGTQTSPRVTAPKPDPGMFTNREERSGPRVTELPPLPPPGSASSGSPISVSKDSSTVVAPAPPVIKPSESPQPPAAPIPPVKEEPAPVTPDPVVAGSPPKGQTAQLEPISVELEPEKVVIAQAAPPTPVKPALPTPAESEASPAPAQIAIGTWAIQISAFQDANRKARAEEHAKKVKSETQMNVVAVPSADEKYYRVLAVGYKDRSAAVAASTELKKKAGYSEVFVRQMP